MKSIEVTGLTKKFGEFISVNDLSFSVEEGEVFGFLGSNGAGKSTTIKMLCAILEPTSGDALVSGYSVSRDPELVKKNIGYMSQKFSLYNDLRVGENIDFFGGIYGLGRSDLQERKRWALRIADLQGKDRLMTGSLPGGIKQRLALATAVIHRPKVVFLDEPTSGVDPISRRNFWDLINDLSSGGTTIFVTTHYLEEAEFCNNIILLDAGGIVAEGNPKMLKTKYLSEDIFELKTTDPVLSLDILSAWEPVHECSLFGTSIHLSLSADYPGEDRLRRLLETNSVSLISMSKITATLEDVFIQLLKKGA